MNRLLTNLQRSYNVIVKGNNIFQKIPVAILTYANGDETLPPTVLTILSKTT